MTPLYIYVDPLRTYPVIPKEMPNYGIVSSMPSTGVELLIEETHSTLDSYADFSSLLYSAGLLGISGTFNNLLFTMICIELMYLGLVSSFILQSAIHQTTVGVIYGLLLLILAACESAVGLGILIVLYRFGETIRFDAYQELRG